MKYTLNLINEKSSRILINLGLLILVIGFILFIWRDVLLDLSQPINSTKIAQLGDFIGGIVGSFWALAGVILFYIALKEQRIDFKTNQDLLKQQIIEFDQQKREFEKSRATNIFYKQIDRVNSSIDNVTLYLDDNKIIKGYESILYLNSLIDDEIIHPLSNININEDKINEVINVINSGLGSLIRLLNSIKQAEEITIYLQDRLHLAELVNLLRMNIDNPIMELIRKISNLFSSYPKPMVSNIQPREPYRLEAIEDINKIIGKLRYGFWR